MGQNEDARLGDRLSDISEKLLPKSREEGLCIRGFHGGASAIKHTFWQKVAGRHVVLPLIMGLLIALVLSYI